jgi:hypothetical protein
VAKDAVFEGEREVRTFVDLSHGADVLLKMAKEDERGSYYTTMSSLLLRAFTFEAYLNHLGSDRIPSWPEIDAIRVMDKYAVLCKSLNITPDFSRRPYQTLGQLFRFRNLIAHGKSVVVKASKVVSPADEPYIHMPRADWEEYSTTGNAERAKTDISEIITELHRVAGKGDYPFIHAIGIGSMIAKPSNNAVEWTREQLRKPNGKRRGARRSP